MSNQDIGDAKRDIMTKPTPSFSISPVRDAADLADTISLFHTYAASLGLDLTFQNFEDEMANMPGKYSPPDGELLLARNEVGTAIGCVGLRPLPTNESSTTICEMKRLYVAASGRGSGVGRALASAVIEAAENLGYGEMRLDTLPSMTVALNVYRKFGFEDIAAYYETPLEGTHFLALKLPARQNPVRN